MSTAAEEVGAENFFARDSKLDLANVCSEVNIEAKENMEKNPEYEDIGSDCTEDPAMVEKVIRNNLFVLMMKRILYILSIVYYIISCQCILYILGGRNDQHRRRTQIFKGMDPVSDECRQNVSNIDGSTIGRMGKGNILISTNV